jgi:hypothetical protein
VVIWPKESGLEVVKAATGGASWIVTVVVALWVLTLLEAVTIAVKVPTSG